VDILGVIPARGGSKGIRRKNLAPLGGRPLIAHTCDAARGSRRLTRVLVSTDDEEVAAEAARLGIEVPFLRPVALAGDDTPMIDVLVDLLSMLDRRESYRPDAVVLLQPTSPFRRAAHIDAAVDLFDSSGADSVVSVVPVPHQFTPSSLMRLDGDRLVFLGGPEGPPLRGDGPPLRKGRPSGRPGEPGELGDGGPGPLRRQDKPVLYARNGPAVAVVRTSVLLEQHTLYGHDTRALVMSREDSLDIDDAFDLELAELLIARAAGRSLA
jgi:CMP-N-acetylneuraminic acid synthetase